MVTGIQLGRLFITLATGLFLSGCAMNRTATQGGWVAKKTLIRECDKGWLQYKVYVMPPRDSMVVVGHKRKQKVPLVMSIMIINTQTGASPLRAISGNLEEYNTYYEYLLNQAKNDFILFKGTSPEYPVYYAFENNYNVFPFETINIGYPGSVRPSLKELKKMNLLYLDKVFSHDTLLMNLGQKI